MITKRTGNGQTECIGCKEKDKFALNWDSFLYNFNDKPYCHDCLMETLENLQQRIDKAIELCNIVLKNEPLENNPNYDLIDQIASIKAELLKGEDKEC